MTIRVFVVDDHVVVRRGVIGLLSTFEGIDCIGQAAEGVEALRELSDAVVLPDVMLLDLMMSGMDGPHTAREVSRLYPSVRIVILTGFDEIERVHSALSVGVAGYVLKTSGPAQLESAIRVAASDQVYIDPAVARQLSERIVDSPLRALSDREQEVLALLAEGMSNLDIASALYISERTARNHVSAVLAKLALSSRTQAALYAVRNGIVRRDLPDRPITTAI